MSHKQRVRSQQRDMYHASYLVRFMLGQGFIRIRKGIPHRRCWCMVSHCNVSRETSDNSQSNS